MKPTSYITLFILSAVLVSSCQKDPISKNGIQPVNKTRYFKREVLPDSLTKLYGYWKLTLIEGGIGGGWSKLGRDFDFDGIEFKPYAIYGLYKKDVLLEYGQLELDIEETDRGFLTYLMNDQNSKEILYPNKKLRYRIILDNNDLFIYPNDLNDAVGYVFERVKK
ncbi:MAG: hypothetical protein ACI8SE_000927 [Bacteroidia bacterium]|jgi:hypothetical protein